MDAKVMRKRLRNIVDAWGKGLIINSDTGIPEILQDGPDIFVIMNRRGQHCLMLLELR